MFFAKGPLTRLILISFAALALIIALLSFSSVWAIKQIEQSQARANARFELASLSARIRSESLALTSLVQRYITQPDQRLTLGQRITEQGAFLDQLVHQAISKAYDQNADERERIEIIHDDLIAFNAQANRILNNLNTGELPNAAIAQELNLLVKDYQTPLLNELRDFEELSARRAQETGAQTQRRIQAIVNALVGIVLGILIATTLMMRWIIQGFAAPLASLQTGVEQIAQGRLDQPVRIHADDELGSLAKMLNHMSAELKESRQQLEDYAFNLECQVAERTYEAEQRAEQAAQLSEIVQKRAAELERLAAQAQAAAQISQAASSTLDLEELLQLSANLMREEFDLYYVGIFLVDESGKSAILRAAAGEASQSLLAGKQKLSLDEKSMVAWSIRNAKPRLAPDVEQENIRLSNPLLPDTGSELTLPLIARSEVIGAMTIQSDTKNAFSPAEITILQTVAGQVANAISNARLYNEVQREKQAAETANRAKSVFLANMSHEIRTPLNAILGFTEVLQYDHNLTNEQREHISIIHRSSESLLTLINNLLDLSKIEANRMTLTEQVFNLHSLLKGIEDLFRLRAIEKGLNFVHEYSNDLPGYLYGDETKLRQVLINLLGNAFKFTEKGRIILQARLASEEEKKTLSPPTYASPVQLYFAVIDTGAGIKLDDLERIFEPFSQTHSGRQAQPGTGLGLAISRQFVRLMGGDLAVESVPGGGSKFSFVVQFGLSQQLEDHAEADLAQLPQLAAGQQDLRLLVVDDQPESRQWLVWLLTMMGFEVRQAASGAEALQIWQYWRPRLIFMDTHVPSLEGYNAALQIKATPEGKSVPIIALTTSAFEGGRNEILSIGCDDFLCKPVRVVELTNILAKHVQANFIVESIKETISQDHLEEPNIPKDPASWESLPAGWVEQMRQAVTVADFEHIFDLINQIRPFQEDLAQQILYFAQKYDVRGLSAILPQREDTSDINIENNKQSDRNE
jgi:signal transduction histidine kinase/DNA-binding NarL/FixJ family response regulator/HAMP domain-containing protein